MDIKNITTATAKVKDLHPNTGQLEPMGVHANPRQISDEKFEKLRKSLEEHNLLGVLPIKAIRYNDEWVVIGGNMRVRALMANGCEDEEVEFIVVPENSDAETIEGLILGDNAQFGDWDMQELGNWSEETLAKWDVDVEKFEAKQEPLIDTDKLINQASSPEATKEYSTDTNYNLDNLYRSKINDEIAQRIEQGIENGEINPQIADVLRTRAQQCSIFNFDEIIKYYRSEDATQTERELLRRLYLVFVAPKELFEGGGIEDN